MRVMLRKALQERNILKPSGLQCRYVLVSPKPMQRGLTKTSASVETGNDKREDHVADLANQQGALEIIAARILGKGQVPTHKVPGL
jgi:hypothetical protein